MHACMHASIHPSTTNHVDKIRVHAFVLWRIAYDIGGLRVERRCVAWSRQAANTHTRTHTRARHTRSSVTTHASDRSVGRPLDWLVGWLNRTRGFGSLRAVLSELIRDAKQPINQPTLPTYWSGCPYRPTEGHPAFSPPLETTSADLDSSHCHSVTHNITASLHHHSTLCWFVINLQARVRLVDPCQLTPRTYVQHHTLVWYDCTCM